jgi:hypothetical protein
LAYAGTGTRYDKRYSIDEPTVAWLVEWVGTSFQHIQRSVKYLKTQTELEDIDSYSSWNAPFIMFCIKAADSLHKQG